MLVLFVTGPTCSGKTTLVESLKKSHPIPSECIILKPGKIIREMFGDDIFVKEPLPDCARFENLVRTLLVETLRICDDLGMFLIVDGFPRSISQLQMIDSMRVGNKKILENGFLLILKPSSDTLIKQINERYNETNGNNSVKNDIIKKVAREQEIFKNMNDYIKNEMKWVKDLKQCMKW